MAGESRSDPCRGTRRLVATVVLGEHGALARSTEHRQELEKQEQVGRPCTGIITTPSAPYRPPYASPTVLSVTSLLLLLLLPSELSHSDPRITLMRFHSQMSYMGLGKAGA